MTPADALRAVLTDLALQNDQLCNLSKKLFTIDECCSLVSPMLTAEREKVETMREWLVMAKIDTAWTQTSRWKALSEAHEQFTAIFGPAPETATEGK